MTGLRWHPERREFMIAVNRRNNDIPVISAAKAVSGYLVCGWNEMLTTAETTLLAEVDG